MEKFALLIPLLLTFLLLRSLFVPMKLGLRLLFRGLSGFICLWMLNCASTITGISLPVNPVTVLISGILGLPGIGLVALMTLL